MQSHTRAALWSLCAAIALSAFAASAQLEGTQIVFTSQRDANHEIYTMDPDGMNPVNLTNNAAIDNKPAWSPDGSKIAFHSDRDRTAEVYDVYIMDADGTNVTLVTDGVGSNSDPDWSPDGSQLTFQSDRAGSWDIYTIDIGGTNLTPLMADGYSDTTPAWSPDGSQIIFVSDRTGSNDIYSVSPAGGTPVAIIEHAAIDGFPAWSPDGSQIAFHSYRDLNGIADIYIGDANGTNPVTNIWRLTEDPVEAQEPSYAPDGSAIAFRTRRHGTGAIQIYTIDLTTLVETRVTDTATSETSPEWSPFAGPFVTVSTPINGDVLPAGTTSTALAVSITNHASPGYWAWQLDTPFPDTGAIPAGATSVPTGDTDTIPGLTDSTTQTVYVALVDGTTDQLLDATTEPGSRASVTFHVGPSLIAVVDPSGVLDFGTTETPLIVQTTAHADPGYWAWQLGTPFPASGAAGGTLVTTGDTDTITGLVDGGEYTVYVALVDAAGDLLSPSVTADSDFIIGPPPDGVTVVNSQGAAGTPVVIPIQIYDVATAGDSITAVDLSLTFDATILTPQTDGTNTTGASLGPVVPVGWTIEQFEPSAGQINISLAADFGNPVTGPGVIVNVGFDINAAAVAGATSWLDLIKADLNEGAIASTPVGGSFVVLDIVYGDVTGNGTVSAYDASWVLEYVVNAALTPPVDVTFPIETTAPDWGVQPLTTQEAFDVADVDEDGSLTAMDASYILKAAVGMVALPVTPAAPALHAVPIAYSLDASATSRRPGARITVSLDASSIPELYAGELRLDFDAGLLSLADVVLRSDGDAATRPLLVHRTAEGQVAVAFASARPIESTGSTLDVTFQVTRQMGEPAEGTIRSSRLRLNGARVDTGFSYPFRVEPYRFALMANYPNPFNPETWIPFELSKDADVTVRVYGLDGKVVRTLDLGYKPMGEYRARESAAYWDGRNEVGERVASGVYVYELTAGDQRAVRRMVISK